MGSQSLAELSPEHQEEVPTKHMAVKSSGIYVSQGETRVCWRPRHPLKEPIHKISFAATHSGYNKGQSEQTRVTEGKAEVYGSWERT